jgi:hypothetical protein
MESRVMLVLGGKKTKSEYRFIINHENSVFVCGEHCIVFCMLK